jgi:hypothetical protein
LTTEFGRNLAQTGNGRDAFGNKRRFYLEAFQLYKTEAGAELSGITNVMIRPDELRRGESQIPFLPTALEGTKLRLPMVER